MILGIRNLDQLALYLLSAQTSRLGFVKSLAAKWLSRPFSGQSKVQISVLYVANYLAIQQIYPLSVYKNPLKSLGYEFRYFDSNKNGENLSIKSSTFVIYQSYEIDRNDAFEQKFSAFAEFASPIPCIFFDWLAPTDLRFSGFVSGRVVGYYKKALLKDTSDYQTCPAGLTNLEHYFSDHFQLETQAGRWSNDAALASTAQTSPSFWAEPNLFDGFSKLERPPRQVGRSIDIHARIVARGSPWYSAMRLQAVAAVDQLRPRYTCTPQGYVARKHYMEELRQSKFCFSPFGYGELCWRDFEAILAGSILVKPNMDHIQCDIPLYRPGETYVSVRWDFEDLEEKIAALRADPEACQAMADAAFDTVKAHLGADHTIKLVRKLEAQALGPK